MKLVWIQEDERRKAQQDELADADLPVLWVLAGKTSQPLLNYASGVVQQGLAAQRLFSISYF